ncbi:VWD domain-containing protein [Oscillatoria sp. CS-180]|uniref:VWD domain-containing protein n=1 Tax=Oscillatoria sp. CS-180 TaxID=3021720 RepID=UPI00232C48C3|nr:VWD domain-containing protein [Oscillatoria sp. CS-180]MDB9526967.1 VWD domain-containing protein [Oscillatoria sp. CS-180]
MANNPEFYLSKNLVVIKESSEGALFTGILASVFEEELGKFLKESNLNTLSILAKNNVFSSLITNTVEIIKNDDGNLEVGGFVLEVAEDATAATIGAALATPLFLALGFPLGTAIFAAATTSSLVWNAIEDDVDKFFLDLFEDPADDGELRLYEADGTPLGGALYSDYFSQDQQIDAIPNVVQVLEHGILNPFFPRVEDLAEIRLFLESQNEANDVFQIVSDDIEELIDESFSTERILTATGLTVRNGSIKENVILKNYFIFSNFEEDKLLVPVPVSGYVSGNLRNLETVSVPGSNIVVYDDTGKKQKFNSLFPLLPSLTIGSSHANFIVGSSDKDVVFGGDADDDIIGNRGQDTLFGNSGSDILYGGADDDVLIGGTGEDFLYGESGNDIFYGGGLRYEPNAVKHVDDFISDVLVGEDGDDIFYVGQGDTVLGGEGTDRVIFSENLDQYEFSILSGGEAVIVTHVDSGSFNRVSNVEFADFADRENVQLLGNTLSFAKDLFTGEVGDSQLVFEFTREGDTSFDFLISLTGRVTEGNATFDSGQVPILAGSNPIFISNYVDSERNPTPTTSTVSVNLNISIPKEDNNPLAGLILIEKEKNTATGAYLDKSSNPTNNRSGRVFSDPRIVTFDDRYYDFQASGEFVLARATEGPQYEVQVRFVKQSRSSNLSIAKAMATSVNGTVISIEKTGSGSSLLINGLETTLRNGDSIAIGEGSISRSGINYTIDHGNGDITSVAVRGSFLNVTPSPSFNNRVDGTIEGLLGNANGDPVDDFQLADGTILETPLAAETMYGDYAASWLIPEEQSLLPGEREPYAPPNRIITIDDLDESTRDAAKQAIKDAGGITNAILLDAAIIDFALTGDAEFIESTRLTGGEFSPLAAMQPIINTFNDIEGTPGNDTLFGDPFDNVLRGFEGDDQLYGFERDDEITGGPGNDLLEGGIGNDILDGGEGNDTYVYGLGDGFDTIDDFGDSTDALFFESSVDKYTLIFQRNSNDPTDLDITTPIEGDLIRILGQFGALRGVEFFRFADGTEISANTIEKELSKPGVTTYSLFEPGAYIASHDDLIDAFGYDLVAGEQHYSPQGASEGRQITFEADDYIASYEDLIQAFGYDLTAGTQHFINQGSKEGRVRDRFDGNAYLNQYEDLKSAFGDDADAATEHYIRHGYAEGRIWRFDQGAYIASHDDLIDTVGYDLAAGEQHYSQYGSREGRQITFEADDYIASYEDLIQVFGYDLEAGTQHFIDQGSKEGRVRDRFDGNAYLNQYDDLKAAFGDDVDAATEHYVRHGYAEGRIWSFDQGAYIASYDDLINAFGYDLAAGEQHYSQYGSKEGRQITFEADEYLASYEDLIQTFGYDLEAGTEHFISFGSVEGRSRNLFDGDAYLNKYADLNAAFGNDLTAAAEHYIKHGYAEGRTWL